MANSTGKILKRADPSTIQDKFLVGYQGWFTCPGDGEPVGPGHHGWLHWFNYPIPDGGRPNADVWPDVSSYSPSELFPAPGLKTKSGEQTFLFSSRNAKTVQRHFHWMAEHSVDGAFLQRFAGQCDMESGNQGIRRIRDEVGERVRDAAEREGRVFAIMYDVSGVPADRIQRILEHDWLHLVHDLEILDSPNYLREKGKAVIALWGFGFDNSGHTPALVRAITQYFRNTTPGGVYIMGGAPAHWRTAESDADRNPEFLDVWLSEFDAISPWTVGRYRTERDADNFAEKKMKGDSALIKSRNEEGTIRKIDYIPVVLPGGSGYNLSEGKWGFNDIKREGGRFLWRQIYNARQLGVRTMYGAMWDEYDEGTAFMPIVEHKSSLPVSDKYPFLSLDEDGYDVPSDWYMRICGLAAEGLRNEKPILETFPVKELQDYWSSRPRYEDVDPKSKDFSSGSSSQWMRSATEDSAGANPGGDGQTYQEWLALQKEEKNDAPPPPYTLEEEPNADRRPDVILTASEVPSVAVQNTAPAVASVRPAASPLAVNHSTYPTSAAPNSREAQVSAQPYPPVPGHSHQPHLSTADVHHPHSQPPSQGHSPQPSVSQHSQSHSPHQAHSPQPFAGQVAQSYPPHPGAQSYPPTQIHAPQSFPPAHAQHTTAQGQVYQADQSYRPSGGTLQPQRRSSQTHTPTWGQQPPSHQPAGGPSYQGYPTSTGNSQGHPPVGAPSQGYTPPNIQSAQSYPTSGGPGHQGYPPVGGSSVQGNHNPYHPGRNQSPDSVDALANNFGRQSISGPLGGNLPTPPPLHPSHPSNSGYNASRPTRLSTPQPRPSSQSPNRVQSQSAHRPTAASSPAQETSKPAVPTQSRPRWPPTDWDSDTPPVPQFSSHHARRPSTTAGANSTRPHTPVTSYSPTGGSTLRPTLSMSTKPPPRPTNMPSAHYPPPISESTYDNVPFYLPATGAPMRRQPGPHMAFPGPEYDSTYMPSHYPGEQDPSMFNSAVHRSNSGMSWPESRPPPHNPTIGFPGNEMVYSGSGSPYGSEMGSQYRGGPPFPSNYASSPPGDVQFEFPRAVGGNENYFCTSMESSSPAFPDQGYVSAPWPSTGPPPPPKPSGGFKPNRKTRD